VLVADFVIPPGNAPHPGKWMDLHMLVMLGGRERTEQDFAVLFESAGFRLSGVVPRAARSRSVEGRRRYLSISGATTSSDAISATRSAKNSPGLLYSMMLIALKLPVRNRHRYGSSLPAPMT
jgi:hypothetical protein